MIKIIFKILKKNLSFKNFKNSNFDVILFDRNYARLDLKGLNTLVYKENNIYLLYLLKSLIAYLKPKNKLSLKENYFKSLYSDFNAKVAVGHDIELRIFDFKKLSSKTKVIVYQHGFYWPIHQARSAQRFKNLKSDFFLIFDKWHKKIFEGVKTKFIINGSVKNNEIKIKNKKSKKKKYDIMYISQFRYLDKICLTEKKSGYESFVYENHAHAMKYTDTLEIFILKILNEYCKKNNKSLCVALASNRKEKRNKMSQEDELKFYNQYLDNFKTESNNSYEIAEKSNLTICLSSNLGPELLSRGKKVLFLNANTLISDWHFLKKEEGPFWYKGKNKDKIFKKIKFLLSCSSDKWSKIIQKNKSIKMPFDQNNLQLKKLINKLI